MKKLSLLLVAALAVLAVFTACNSSTAATTAPATTAAAEDTEPEGAPGGPVAGGWTINDDETTGYLPEDVQADFDKATEGLAGVGYTPVALLGTQVVAGLNEMILCKGTTVTAEPVTSLYVMVIYRNPQGEVEITNISDFDLGAIKEGEDADEEQGLAGGWTHNSDYKVPNMPADVQKAFDTATEGLVGAGYDPMAYLGSQVVAGANYAVLCHQTLMDKDATEKNVVMYIYADLDGGAEITDIKAINLSDFNN